MSFIGHTNPLITVQNLRRSYPRASHSLTATRLRRKKTEYTGNPDIDREINLYANSTMPRTYKPKKRQRKRRGIIRKPIPRAITPNSKLIRAKVVDYQNYTPTGALAAVEIQMNSIDDPFQTAGTGQPLGYDQWKALYKHAYVLGSKVTVKAHNNGTSACMIGITPMKPAQGSTNLTSYEHYMELPSTKSRILSPDVDHCTFSHKVSTKKFLSIKDIRDNDDFKIDLVNETPPSTVSYWFVWAQAMDATAVIDIDTVITVDYIILLTDPIVPSRSTET